MIIDTNGKSMPKILVIWLDLDDSKNEALLPIPSNFIQVIYKYFVRRSMRKYV